MIRIGVTQKPLIEATGFKKKFWNVKAKAIS